MRAGRVQDVLRGRAAVLQIVFRLLAEDGDADRRLRDELAVVGRIGDALARGRVLDDHEPPRLDIDGRRRQPAAVHDVLDQLPRYRFVLVRPDTSSGLHALDRIHVRSLPASISRLAFVVPALLDSVFCSSPAGGRPLQRLVRCFPA